MSDQQSGLEEIEITDEDLTTITVLTPSGVCFLHWLWWRIAWLIAIAFIALKVWDYRLGTTWEVRQKQPISLNYWWEYLISGVYGKLDDISFWTVIVGVLSGVLVLYTTLLLLSAGPKLVKIAFCRRDLFTWLVLTLSGWSIYFFAIALPKRPGKGTFLTELPPDLRWAQVFEGVLNLAAIALVYAGSVLAWKIANICHHELKAFGQTTSSSRRAKALLKAASLLRNIPVVIFPILILIFVALEGIRLVGDRVFSFLRWAPLDFHKYRFNPLAEINEKWPIAVFYFVLLIIPLSIPCLRFRKPKWAIREWVMSGKTIFGWTTTEVLLKTQDGDEKYRIRNPVLFLWHP